jgi:GT2 family glycosyltransferase
VTFSCVYIKRECIGAVGTMDMQVFPYAGDTDYSRRAREDGFANVYCPTAWALHQQESTTVVLVMRAMSAKEWNDRSAESQRYFYFKWANRHAPDVELPADIFAETQNWPGR